MKKEKSKSKKKKQSELEKLILGSIEQSIRKVVHDALDEIINDWNLYRTINIDL